MRLIFFLISLIAIVVIANERLLSLLWFAVPLAILGFVLILIRYNHLTHHKKAASFFKEINKNELLKLENKLSSFPSGELYLSKDHAYVADLDVFGSHSLFQLLNRTTTESGSHLLAEWLSDPASKEIILARQQAIQELKPNLKWRQELQVAGLPFVNSKSDYQKLLKWVEQDNQLLPKQSKYLLSSIALAVLSTVSAVLYVINSNADNWILYLVPFLIVMIINYLILKKVAPIAENIIDHTDQNVQILGGYEKLAQTILSNKFQSAKLKKLYLGLSNNKSSASTEIRKLRKILEQFQLRGSKRIRGNQFYPVFNNLWLFDIYWIILTERWKSRNRNYVKSWIDAISEFEVLNSIAGFAYSNQDVAFPEITEEPFILDFEKLGHPLIKEKDRVCNNFSLKKQGQIAMITGSNMAGKSTFLRTVGVNLILALMGAPCCAQFGTVSHLKMFTSMRTQDNLEEGISSFYAKLKKVEQLLLLIKKGEPIFFMLDEMFKGTNSQDRYKGGVSLIKQLSELNAFGMISTHDLEMAKLAGKNMIVSNHSFNSTLHRGDMSFNYKLEEGICTDFNASELMRKSGIKLLSNIEDIKSINNMNT